MKNSSQKLLLNYRDFLRNIFPQSIGYLVNNELIIKISPKKIKRVLTFLKNHTQCQFKILVDMCGVDYPEKKNRFEVIYNLLSISYNSRITVSVSVDEKTPIDSVTPIFSGADWLEREV
jgi:NADH:ubiquinone oxidoreductase subunit C